MTKIRVLPARYASARYPFTCKQCGCHLSTILDLSGFVLSNSTGPKMLICEWCGAGHKLYE